MWASSMRRSQPLVSVIIPVFNCAQFILQSIKSVINQTYENLEIIIINDGSTDSTNEILEKITDPRVKIYHQKNQGMAKSLNRAISLSCGHLIARHDADDIMLENRIERQVHEFINRPKLQVLATLGYYIDTEDNILGRVTSDITPSKIEKWYKKHCEPIGLLHPSVMYRKLTITSVGGYRHDYWPSDDIDLWNRLVEVDAEIDVLQIPLMYYRLHSSSAVANQYFRNRMIYRWTRHNMQNRRSGKSEITFNYYKRHFPTTSNQKRKDFAKYLIRNSSMNLKSKNIKIKSRSYLMLMLALIIDPLYLSNKILSKIIK